MASNLPTKDDWDALEEHMNKLIEEQRAVVRQCEEQLNAAERELETQEKHISNLLDRQSRFRAAARGVTHA